MISQWKFTLARIHQRAAPVARRLRVLAQSACAVAACVCPNRVKCVRPSMTQICVLRSMFRALVPVAANAWPAPRRRAIPALAATAFALSV